MVVRWPVARFNIKVITAGELPRQRKGLCLWQIIFLGSDIHALNSLIPLRFIAKSDIKNWPVFGYLVQKADTLFIDRNKRQDAGRIVEMTAESLSQG